MLEKDDCILYLIHWILLVVLVLLTTGPFLALSLVLKHFCTHYRPSEVFQVHTTVNLMIPEENISVEG